MKEHHHSSPKLKNKSVHLILSLPIPKTTSDLIPTWCSPETWLSVLPSHASGSIMPLLKNNTNYGSNPFSLLPQRVQHLIRLPPNSLCFRNRINGSLAGDTGPSKSLRAWLAPIEVAPAICRQIWGNQVCTAVSARNGWQSVHVHLKHITLKLFLKEVQLSASEKPMCWRGVMALRTLPAQPWVGIGSHFLYASC